MSVGKDDIEKAMKVSIIVPVFNVESRLRKCLDSLFAQDLQLNEYEIILVDDGSTDKSLAICEEYASVVSNCIVLTQENYGVSCARATGLKSARGEYIFFVDSDDFIVENVLNELYVSAHENKCDILFFNFAVIGENTNVHFRSFPDINCNVKFTGEDLVCRTTDYGSLWKGIYRRGFIEDNNIHFTKGIIHEDTDFNLQAYPLANRLMIIDKEVYYYCCFGESLTRTQSITKRQLNLYSDFVVCGNVKSLICTGKLSRKVVGVYEKHCNSVLIGTIVQLLKNRRKYGQEFVQKCMNYSFDYGLLPMKCKTNSWKATLFVPIVNMMTSLYYKYNK